MMRVILVVEDNAITRKVVRLTLDTDGFRVVEASTAIEALALAASIRPDLVLQDLLLPDMDGLDLVVRLRAVPAMEGVPIVAFSGFLSRLEFGRAAALGFTDFLPKPVDPSRLLQVVRTHLPASAAGEVPSGGGRRVLLADDDPVQLKVGKLRLRGLGFAVETAIDGVDALEVLRRTPVDIVLSDVLMPRMDGFRLCGEIRRDATLAHLPVVLMSSNYVEDADRVLARRMGANACVARRPDLGAALEALGAAVAEPRETAIPTSSTTADHFDRVIQQLERHAAMNAVFAQRSAMQASMLSVMAGISETLTRHRRIEDSLHEILASLLDASGTSRGALFVGAGTTHLTLGADLGFDKAAATELITLCGRRELFDGVIAAKAPRVVATSDGDPAVREFLAAIGVGSALLIPFTSGEECLGVLLLGSSARDLTEPDWIAFARMIAVQIGQAFVLSRAVVKLAESEQRSRTLLDCATESIVTADLGGQIEDVNPEAVRFLARTKADLIGRSVFELIAPIDRDNARRDLAGPATNGKIAVEAVPFVRPDGATVIADISATIIELAGKRLVLSIWRDVTDKHRTAFDLQFLRDLALAGGEATDLGSMFDAVLRTIGLAAHARFSAAWSPSGAPPTLACDRYWTRDPEDRERLEVLTESTFRAGEGVLGRALSRREPHWIVDLAHEDGCTRSASAIAVGIRAGLVIPIIANDAVIAILEFFTDTTGPAIERIVALAPAIGAQLAAVAARQRAEADLVEQVRQARLAGEVGLALANADDASVAVRDCVDSVVRHLDAALAQIWTVDRSGTRLELQASAGAATPIAGWGASVPIGELEIGRIAKDKRAHASDDVYRDPAVGDPTWARHERIRTFAGYPLVVGTELVGVIAMFSCHRLSDAAKSALAGIADAIAVGIQRKRLEATNKQLELQLRQAQKMEAVGRLAGGVAHDFNNMLSVVLSYAEMLREDLRPGEPMRDDLDEICNAGKRAAGLTRQLLMFSRQQIVAPQILDLDTVLRDTDKMLRRILGEDIDLVSLYTEGLAPVLCDLGSIEQVIMNLVINARDAMPTGGKLTIETANLVLDQEYVRVHPSATAGPHIMLAVSDTGIGMDHATQARIFEPFFTTKGVGKGTGLGLSTVFGIVQQSGGSVWVYSEPGVGTTFKVYLPVAHASANHDDRVGIVPSSYRGTETILLVEDEDQVRGVARDILRRQGYQVIEARNAGEALLLVEGTQAIDLLLTDVVMPNMSGPELAKRIAGTRPGLRILCMSGYTDDSIVRHGVLDATIAFLQKPFTPETLGRRVREVLAPRT